MGHVRRRWVTALFGLVSSASVPVLTLSALGLGVTGVLLDVPAYAAGGICCAGVGLLVERRRYYDLEDRLVRLRTRLRVARQRSDSELVELREQVRLLERELWEYRLVDQMGPQARTLIHGMAATLARPYVPPTDIDREDWDLFDTHPIDLATLQGLRPEPEIEPEEAEVGPAVEPEPVAEAEPVAEPAAEEAEADAEVEPEVETEVEPEVRLSDEPPPLPVQPRRPPSPHHPEPPTVELPVIRPGAPAGVKAFAAQGEAATVVDLRTRPAEVEEPVTDVRDLDEKVYRQLAEAVQDELAATLEPPRRTASGKPFSGTSLSGKATADHGAVKDPAVKGTATVPDDPGRRTA